MFDDGIDIYNSLLFRHDICLKDYIINNNPYLQGNNYEKLQDILQKEKINININTFVADITKYKFNNKYDLVNLSNILSYYYNEITLKEMLIFLKTNFNLNSGGEIINYFYSLNPETIERINTLLNNGYIEDIEECKLFVYK